MTENVRTVDLKVNISRFYLYSPFYLSQQQREKNEYLKVNINYLITNRLAEREAADVEWDDGINYEK